MDETKAQGGHRIIHLYEKEAKDRAQIQWAANMELGTFPSRGLSL
jgi:hypothetical protein